MFDYRFADHAALNLLALVPVLVFLLYWTRRRTKAVMATQFSNQLAPFLTRSLSTRRRKIKIWLQVIALFFFIFALARPQSGEGKQKAKSEGLEIILAVDVSNSMLAEDARPSRLGLAQKELSRFVDSLSGDKVGVVAFAGSAILLSPLTSDKNAIKMYLESLSPAAVSTQGTDFKKALNESVSALARGGIDNGAEAPSVTRVIVIASDGEDNEKGALEYAEKIASDGVRIFTLGFGTLAGGQIPVRDEHGNLVGYKKDRSGQVVVTKSTGETLQKLAEYGKGTYQQVTFGGDAVLQLRQSIDTLQRAQFESLEISHYIEHYQIFLAFGLVLAALELFLGERKSEGRIWRGRFEVALD